MSKPVKKPAAINKDILGMFGINIKQVPKQPVVKPIKSKLDMVKPVVLKPSVPAIMEPISTSSEPDLIKPPLDNYGPTPKGDQITPDGVKSLVSPAIYKRGIFGWYVCRNCGRAFEGRPIIHNHDPQRSDKYNIRICPLCGECGLVECNEDTVQKTFEICSESIFFPFIINNPRIKLLDYSKDPNVKQVYGEKNGKGQV